MTGAKLLGGMFLAMGAGLIVLGLITNDAVFAGCGGTMAAACIPCFVSKQRSGTCCKKRRCGTTTDDEMVVLMTAATVASSAS